MVEPRSPVRTLRAAVPRSSRTSTPRISARGRQTRSGGPPLSGLKATSRSSVAISQASP